MTIPQTEPTSTIMEVSAPPPLYFFALGDTGSGDSNQMEVAAAMEKRCNEISNLNGLLLLGDLFYMTGVTGAEDPQWNDKIVKPYSSPCLSKASMFPIFGNHDYRGNKEAFIRYDNPRWKMPHRFYSVNFTTPILPRMGADGKPRAVENRSIRDPRHFLRFIAIDSNFTDLCLSPNDCVLDFVKQELEEPAVWKIILSHHPLSSASKKKSNYTGETAFGYIYRWLICDSATAWVSGHSHHLEHRKLAECGADLFISGGGGGNLDPIDINNTDMKFGSSEYGFLEFEVSQQSLKARFFNKDSKILYEKEILRK